MSPSGHGTKGSLRAVPALLLGALACGGLEAAGELAVITAAESEWRARLISALEAVERGEFRSGIEGLQAAVSEGRDAVMHVPAELGGEGRTVRESLLRLGRSAARAPRAESSKEGRGRPEDAVRGRQLRQNPPRFAGFVRGTRTEPAEIWGRYLQVATVARLLLSRLPGEALDAYESRFEPAAQRLFDLYEASGDPLVLDEIAAAYPLTSSGCKARELIGDAEFEHGEYEHAWLEYRTLVEDAARKLDAPARARIECKRLLALRMAGRLPFEKERMRVLSADLSEDVREEVEQFVRRLEDHPPPSGDAGVERASPFESHWGGELPSSYPGAWPQLPETPARPLQTSWWSWTWAQGIVVDEFPADSVQDFHFRVRRSFSLQGVEFPFVPLYDEENVYLSGVFDLYRLDGRPGGGKVLQEIAKPSPPSIRSQFREQSDSPLYATTLWRRDAVRPDRRAALASLPEKVLLTHFIANGVRGDHYMGYDITVQLPMRSVLAADAGTGRVLWKTTDARPVMQRDPYGPNEIPVDISYTSPLVVRDGLVFGGGWKQDGYVTSVVRALDLRTGKTVWERAISGSQMEQTMFGEIAREPFASFLLEDDGVLYFLSNLGAVAALERETGRVLWTTVYDALLPQPTNGRAIELRDLAWGPCPPLLLGHVLVVAPRDSSLLLAIDTGRGPEGPSAGGKVLWYHDNLAGELHDLLGYHGGRLYFTGPAGVAALDISALSPLEEAAPRDAARGGAGPRPPASGPAPRDAEGDAGRWERLRELPEAPRVRSGIAGRPAPIAAPGLLARDGIIYADDEGLARVDFGLREREGLFGELSPSEAKGYRAGRVLSAGRLILVVSKRWLAAYGAPIY